MKDKGYFKKKDGAIIVDVPYLEAYIPDYYFKSAYAEMKGSVIEAIGLFNYRVGNEEKIEDAEVELFPFPSTIELLPSTVEKKNIKLFKIFPKERYRVLKLFKGDKIVKNYKVVKGVDNVELYYKLFNSGKIPKGIPYNKLSKLFYLNHAINGMSMRDVKPMAFDIVVAASCRDMNDHSKPYRMSKSFKPDGINYALLNTMDTVKSLNTFAALGGDDINKMLTASINRKHKGDKGVETPLEKIMRH